MKKLIIPENGSTAIIVDVNTLEVKPLYHTHLNIDSSYILDEDMEITYKDKIIEGNKGDIALTLYSYNGNPNELIIIKSDDLVAACKKYKEDREISQKNNSCGEVCCEKCTSN